ncbi:MAG: N-acetyl-gamma-glutamyl-phosphate reductase, partial [Acidimicrobiales bacterium]
MKVGIFGASGYAGAELMRICFGHPAFEVAFAGASTYAGQFVGDLYPSLATAYPAVRYQQSDPAAVDGLDVAFLALPHGMSQELAGQLRRRVGAIVDLSG